MVRSKQQPLKRNICIKALEWKKSRAVFLGGMEVRSRLHCILGMYLCTQTVAIMTGRRKKEKAPQIGLKRKR